MNIVDYLHEYGNISLKESSFNEVDNLVICQMGYSRIDKYFNDKDSYTIAELNKLYFNDHSENQVQYDASFIGHAPFVLKAMAESERFKNARVINFKSIIDEEKPEQYCSFEVELDDGTSYIAFRGTDDTLIGWKESFELMYKEIAGETQALNYLKNIYNPNKKYRIGGHSKGGALASFSAIMFPEMHDNIINVYSNDGVGLNPKILPKNYHDNFKTLKGKFIKIIPESDFFGALFSNPRKKRVIKANGVALMQHDPMNWQVQDNHFIPGTLNKETVLIRDIFENFINNVSDNEFKQFIDGLNETLAKEGLYKINGITKGMIPAIIAGLKSIKTMSPSSKKVINELINALSKTVEQKLEDDKKFIKREIFNIKQWTIFKNKRSK